MASTQHDMLGSRAWVDSEGFHQIRKFQITGMTASTLSARTLVALNTGPDIPKVGWPHPHGTFAHLAVMRVSCETAGDDPTTVNGEIEYGPPTLLSLPPSYDADKAIISVNTVTAEVETQFLADGVTQITTNHGLSAQPAVSKPVAGSVKYFAPTSVVAYERREPESPAANFVAPGQTRASFVGTLNSVSVFGDPARTWLCTEVSGTSSDGAQTWLVRYAFTRSPKVSPDGLTVHPWDPQIVEIDPGTGNFVVHNPDGDPPHPLEDGKGKKLIQVQGERNFTLLSLTI